MAKPNVVNADVFVKDFCQRHGIGLFESPQADNYHEPHAVRRSNGYRLISYVDGERVETELYGGRIHVSEGYERFLTRRLGLK